MELQLRMCILLPPLPVKKLFLCALLYGIISIYFYITHTLCHSHTNHTTNRLEHQSSHLIFTLLPARATSHITSHHAPRCSSRHDFAMCFPFEPQHTHSETMLAAAATAMISWCDPHCSHKRSKPQPDHNHTTPPFSSSVTRTSCTPAM